MDALVGDQSRSQVGDAVPVRDDEPFGLALHRVEGRALVARDAGEALVDHLAVVGATALHVVRPAGARDVVGFEPEPFGGDSGQQRVRRGVVAFGGLVERHVGPAPPAGRAGLPDPHLWGGAATDEGDHGVRGLVVRQALGWQARRRFGRVVAARIKAADEERRRAAEAIIREAEQVTGAAALLFGPDTLRQRATGATGPRPTSDNTPGDRDDERQERSRRFGWLRVAGRGDREATEITDSEPVVIDGVDITDLMPAARQAATELGDRLSRDALCEALRAAGLSVGGKRRKAVYDAVLAERDRAA